MKYSYDIAISLCKQDVEFARKLVKAINPSLKLFFYETNQEELISESGPESFAKVFKEQSRVVVVLSRDEWGKSFYTDIECNAIVDRLKPDGFGFLVIIPMAQDETPSWYPSTKIYASPFNFSIEELAHFIEFKVVERDGVLKNITIEDRYENLLERIDQKKATIAIQTSKEAIHSAIQEVADFKDCFNSKSDFLRKNTILKVAWSDFSYVHDAYLSMGDYVLSCRFDSPFAYFQIVTTQDFIMTIELFQIFGSEGIKKSIMEEQRVFLYTEKSKGWALPNLYETATQKECEVLFRNRDHSKFYDLIKLAKTETLVDEWFQKLLHHSTQNIERYL